MGPFAVTDDDGAAAPGDCVDVPVAATPSGSSQSRRRAVPRVAGRELRSGATGSRASAVAMRCARGCTCSVACIRLAAHMEAEVDEKQILDLQLVHLGAGHAAHLGVVGVVEIVVVEELGGQHDARDDNAVHVELRKHKALHLVQAVHVH
ncbi:hypothetical protein GQ600_2604 [Phytophthora cactorum]|nr:hypothetical protein GQ600_2604 [Phytophthora cactorum]